MLLYRTSNGFFVQNGSAWHLVPASSWDELFNRNDLAAYLAQVAASSPAVAALSAETILAPIGTQEVWAAGVTYFRSRTARMGRRSSSRPRRSGWHIQGRRCTCVVTQNGWCLSPS